MFWTDWGSERPQIERAGMDGTARKVIITENVAWPNGLSLDLVTERMYWVDAKNNLIGEADLDGGKARVVLKSESVLYHPFSVAVFEDWVYWSEWNHNNSAVYRALKHDGTCVKQLMGKDMVRLFQTLLKVIFYLLAIQLLRKKNLTYLRPPPSPL